MGPMGRMGPMIGSRNSDSARRSHYALTAVAPGANIRPGGPTRSLIREALSLPLPARCLVPQQQQSSWETPHRAHGESQRSNRRAHAGWDPAQVIEQYLEERLADADAGKADRQCRQRIDDRHDAKHIPEAAPRTRPRAVKGP